jgi:hypothetical protein
VAEQLLRKAKLRGTLGDVVVIPMKQVDVAGSRMIPHEASVGTTTVQMESTAWVAEEVGVVVTALLLLRIFAALEAREARLLLLTL